MRYLWNPFYKLAGWKALIFGLVSLIIMSVLGGFFNAHFDGVLDLHIAKQVKYSSVFIENGLNLISLVVVFGFAAYFLNGFKYRFIDLIGIMSFVKMPYIVILPLAYLFSIKDKTDKLNTIAFEQSSQVSLSQFESISFVSFSVLSILIIILSVIWIYNGFKILSNSRGLRLNMAFIVGIILSELLSKLLIGIAVF